MAPRKAPPRQAPPRKAPPRRRATSRTLPPPSGAEVEAARGGMYMGQGRSPITTYGTGVKAPGPYGGQKGPVNDGMWGGPVFDGMWGIDEGIKQAEKGFFFTAISCTSKNVDRNGPKRPKNPPKLPGTR
jgi:hypothetical protein